MKEHIDYQTITQNGKPAFVVIPYNDFIKIYPDIQNSEINNIPHEVVGIMLKKNISRIAAWREYLGFTQLNIAKKLGISQSAFSQIEALDANPKNETYRKIAKVFGLELDQLK